MELLNHGIVQLKLIEHCMSTILRLKKIYLKKRNDIHTAQDIPSRD